MGTLSGYLFLILAETVLIRKSGELRYEWVPFWSWMYVFEKWPLTHSRIAILKQILLNIAMFIPIGFLLGHKGWKSVGISAGISLIIELCQLISRRGLFEFDDIVHNTLGAVVGLGLCVSMKRVLDSINLK